MEPLHLQVMWPGHLTDQQVWFPVDFQETFSRKFYRICSFIDIYRVGSLTPGITLILFTQAIAQLKDIYRGLIAPISINPGLLKDVFTGTLWSTRILSQPEHFQETLIISSRFTGFRRENYSSRFPGFPGVLDTLVTSRHRGPKRKLWVGYRAPSLQRTSYLWVGLFCETSSIFHHRVWYHALSALCAYSTFGHHSHPLGYPCAIFHFCCAPAIAELARREKSHTQSLTQSPSLFDVPGTKAFALEYHMTLVSKMCAPTFPLCQTFLASY